MNTKDKINVMQAFLDGKVIQIYEEWREDWLDYLDHEPTWNWQDCSYRIKPQKQLVIPWEHIKPEYKWAAMNSDGEVFVFYLDPWLGEQMWWPSGCRNVSITSILNIDTTDIDWKQSLIKRPEGV